MRMFPLTFWRLRRKCEVMSTWALWLETVMQFWRGFHVCLCSSTLVQAAEWFWGALVKFPLEETKLKLPLQKCYDGLWRHRGLRQGVDHIVTRCSIKYLCCEDTLESSIDPTTPQSISPAMQKNKCHLCLSVYQQLLCLSWFCKRPFIFYRGVSGFATLPLGHQPNLVTISFSNL